MQHTDWDDLPGAVRRAVEERTGPVRTAQTVPAGRCSHLAAVLHAGHGQVFLKGIPEDDPGTVRQHREALINPYVQPLAPRLLWHHRVAGWDLLAFEYIAGARHADYSPGSPDLPDVVAVMNRLGQIPCPDLPVKQAGQRWAAYLDDPAAARLLAGERLLHTDFNPLNVLIASGRTWLIDWAWPTRGAAFIDPACFLIRLMASGHSAKDAEWWAEQCRGWSQAPDKAIDAFATGSARLFAEIAGFDPQPWKLRLAAAAREWARYRSLPT